MTALLLFALAILVSAAAISTFLWRRFADEAPGPWERAASIAVLTFVLAIAINWLLSWLHLLDRSPLLIAAFILAIPSAVLLVHWRPRDAAATEIRDANLLAYLIPLLVWIVFSLWRGAIVPPLSHDALAYHLPKAVMLERAHRFEFFNAPDPRISTSPPNYELLLADVLLLTGVDDLTEWISTAAYVALLLLGAALVERWWKSAPAVVATMILIAAVPVILLHSGAQKNDVLSNVFYLAGLLWAGRWFVTRETAPLILSLVSLAAGGGTKLQAVFIAAAIFLVFVWLAIRERLRLTRSQLTIVVAAVALAFVLFGAWAYVANVLHTGEAALPASSSSDAGYGDWNNLWEVPILLLWRPFDPGRSDVFVPWRGERWFWPYYELYFSDFGMLVSILVLLLPFAIRRYGRTGTPEIQRERVLTSIAALLGFALMLPIRIRPLGFFAGFPRYFSFIAIIVLAWTIAPLVADLQRRERLRTVKAILAGAAIVLSLTAAVYSLMDSFQPLEYVLDMVETPERRAPYFMTYRAGTLADMLAGPNDTMAIQGGFDAWVYPLYGRTLQRKVLFVEPGKPIPSEAKWVVIDRGWNIIWGHPRFANMGQYRQYLVHGHATAEDLALFKELRARPDEWKLVYFLPVRNQFIFRRRDAAPPPQRPAAPIFGSSH